MANNRTCLACGNSYEYCGSCPNSRKFPIWKNIFDTENCKLIFETVSDYAQNVISKERAIKKLSECDLSCTNNLKEQIKSIVNEIMFEEKAEPINENTIKQDIPKEKYSDRKKKLVKNENDD